MWMGQAMWLHTLSTLLLDVWWRPTPVSSSACSDRYTRSVGGSGDNPDTRSIGGSGENPDTRSIGGSGENPDTRSIGGSVENPDPECDVLEITTPDTYVYIYLEDYGLFYAADGYMLFLVKAHNDVHVALSTRKDDWLKDSYEVVIGGWYNTRSAIRPCHQCNPVVQTDHNPLDENFFLPFWVSWSANEIRVGHGTELLKDEFLHWESPGTEMVNYIGISTGWGAEGNWIFGVVNGGWSAWSSWGECSVSCGGGTQTRTRACDDPVPSYGSACEGDYIQSQLCGQVVCPVHGGWSSWSLWSSCSLTCGQGQSSRSRSCDEPLPENSGEECPGPSTESLGCMDRECPVDGVWSSWGQWGACSHSCGTGTEERRRSCSNPPPQHGGQRCSGMNSQIRDCLTRDCEVDGSWSSWAAWGACTLTCGQGRRTRTRHCDDPPPQSGGQSCPGANTDVDTCKYFECKVNGQWSSWGTWGSCSVTCGYGLHERRRQCDDPTPQFQGNDCDGADSEVEPCTVGTCSVDGEWSSWSSWGSCSSTCGQGIHTRARTCSAPAPSAGGRYCPGPAADRQACQELTCPGQSGWSDWGTWSFCSETCGTGLSNRHRTCINHGPDDGDVTCLGSDEQTATCQDMACPVSGGWSFWGQWSRCSVDCDYGHIARFRACDNPPPENDGSSCAGEPVEYSSCQNDTCAVEGGWSPWSPWTQCSHSCGNGTILRARWCGSPAPGRDGESCSVGDTLLDMGIDVEEEHCLVQMCPIDGSWTSWGQWSVCSRSCAGGTRERYRNCSAPAPQFGGHACFGPSKENDSCSLQECPQLIHWTEWSKWSDCTLSCDAGMRHRGRECIGFELDPYNNYTCPGRSLQNVSCNIQHCPGDIWPDSERIPTESPNATTIAAVQFIILGILLALFLLLDTFTVYNHVRFAWQNIQDFFYTCGERRRKKKMLKQLGAQGTSAVAAQEEDLEQTKPLCDGDGDGGHGRGAGRGGSADSGSSATLPSERRALSDSEPTSDSGSARDTPRLTGSGRKWRRSISTASDKSIPAGLVIPKKKPKKEPKKQPRSKIIGMLAIRRRPESVKKKPKRRPRRRASVAIPDSEQISHVSTQPSGMHENIREENVDDLAIYDTADTEPRQASAGETSCTTEQSSVVHAEPKSKPPVRKTSGKGQKKGKKKSTKRKTSSGKGAKGASKKPRPAEKSGKKTLTKKGTTLKNTDNTRMNNLSAREQDLGVSQQAGFNPVTGTSTDQLTTETNQYGTLMANIDASQPSTSKFYGDKYHSNIDIQHSLQPHSKNTMTIKAKTFREKLANIRLRKKKEFNLDPELGLVPSYMTNTKRQNVDVQRSLHKKKLNIASTTAESDIPNTPASVIAGHDDVPEGVTFEDKSGFFSKISSGVKRKLNNIFLPKQTAMSSDSVVFHPPSEIIVDSCMPPRPVNEHYDHPKPPVPIDTAKPAQRNLTLAFLEKEFSDGGHDGTSGPAITPEELREMYRVKFPGQNVLLHRGYVPLSSRYMEKHNFGKDSGAHGHLAQRPHMIPGIISSDVSKNISLPNPDNGPSTSYASIGHDVEMDVTRNAREENPWQLCISEGPPAYDQNGGSIEENDQVNPLGPAIPVNLAVKPLDVSPENLSSPSGISTDGSSRSLIPGNKSSSFPRCFPGATQVHRLLAPRQGDRMCYNVEEGHLEDIEEAVTCPNPARLVAVLGQSLPRLHFRRGMSPSATKDSMDISNSGRVRSGPSLLRKLLLPCQNKRYSLDDTCLETIAKDLEKDPMSKTDMLHEARRHQDSNLYGISEDPSNDSDFSSYYRAVLPKY